MTDQAKSFRMRSPIKEALREWSDQECCEQSRQLECGAAICVAVHMAGCVRRALKSLSAVTREVSNCQNVTASLSAAPTSTNTAAQWSSSGDMQPPRRQAVECARLWYWYRTATVSSPVLEEYQGVWERGWSLKPHPAFPETGPMISWDT